MFLSSGRVLHTIDVSNFDSYSFSLVYEKQVTANMSIEMWQWYVVVRVNCMQPLLHLESLWMVTSADKVGTTTFKFVHVCIYRVARSLCQSGGGRFRTMPLYRHCEKYSWPKVESTLWSVSPSESCKTTCYVMPFIPLYEMYVLFPHFNISMSF